MCPEDSKITRDVAFPVGKTDQGNLVVARVQGTGEAPVRTMVGEVRPLQEGVPITGDVVRLTQGCEGHYHVETLLEDPRKADREKKQPDQDSPGGSNVLLSQCQVPGELGSHLRQEVQPR